MPTYFYKKFEFCSLKSTTIILQLANTSVARTEGVVENVLVELRLLIFQVDFVMINFEPNPEVLFI